MRKQGSERKQNAAPRVRTRGCVCESSVARSFASTANSTHAQSCMPSFVFESRGSALTVRGHARHRCDESTKTRQHAGQTHPSHTRQRKHTARQSDEKEKNTRKTKRKQQHRTTASTRQAAGAHAQSVRRRREEERREWNTCSPERTYMGSSKLTLTMPNSPSSHMVGTIPDPSTILHRTSTSAPPGSFGTTQLTVCVLRSNSVLCASKVNARRGRAPEL
eukprot:1494804-Rhodomonas_salina.2